MTTSETLIVCSRCGRHYTTTDGFIFVYGVQICGVCQWEKEQLNKD